MTVVAGTLALQNGGTAGSGTLTLDPDGNFYVGQGIVTVANAISGYGTFTNDSASGVTTLSGANSGFTGVVNLNSGILLLNSATALGAPSAINFNGGRLRFSASNSADYSAYFAGTAGSRYNLDTNGRTVTLATSFGGAAGNGNTLLKTGAGTLLLAAANTATGATTIAGGTLRLDDGGSLGAGGVVFASDGSGGTPTLAFGNTGTSTFASAITGAGAVAQNGSGTTVITGANTYTGGTTIAAGTIRIGDGGSLGTGAVANNGALVLGNTGTQTFANAVSGSGSLTQAGAGTTLLTADNTYAGVTNLNAGVLAVGSYGAITQGSAKINFNGGTLRYDAASTPDYSSRFSSADGQQYRVDTNGKNIAYASAIGATGTASLTKLGAGTLTLSAANGYTGGTTVAAGTLALSGSGRLADTGALTVAGGTFDLGSVADTVGAVTLASGTIQNGTLAGASYTTKTGTISANLAGTGALTQNGAGTTVLSGNNTYTGPTVISAGRLVVNGSIANSATTVNSGGTLAGAGATGALTLNSGAFITPGATGDGALGTLTGTTLTWNGGGVMKFDLGAAGLNDKLVLSGALTKGAAGSYAFDFLGTGVENGTYTLITAGSVAGFSTGNFTVSNLSAGLTGSIRVDGGDIVLAVVPEPREYALGLGVAAVLIAGLRRRRRS